MFPWIALNRCFGVELVRSTRLVLLLFLQPKVVARVGRLAYPLPIDLELREKGVHVLHPIRAKNRQPTC
jgi:hypothetical protein